MCGRAYHTYTDEELELRYLNRKTPKLPEFSHTYNLAPSQFTPVVWAPSGERQISMFRWGWRSLELEKKSSINARQENLRFTTFGKALGDRRCIVPLTGFFEWRRDGKEKRPFAIYARGGGILSAAGLYEVFQDPKSGEAFDCFSIITTAANTFMNDVHDRMPIFLDRETESAWLDSALRDPKEVRRLLKPTPDEYLAMHEISTLVNSPKNNRPELLEPVSQLGLGIK